MLDENIRKELIQKGRDFMKGYRSDDPYLELDESDQTRKLPQPPLVKAPMRGEDARIALPRSACKQGTALNCGRCFFMFFKSVN